MKHKATTFLAIENANFDQTILQKRLLISLSVYYKLIIFHQLNTLKY